MREASAKPRVVTSTVGSPLRSSRALVATVVPILTAAMSATGIGSPSRTPSTARIPAIAASSYRFGSSESSLWVTSVPSPRRATTSVKVPPRSIQNSQRLAMDLIIGASDLRSPGLPERHRVGDGGSFQHDRAVAAGHGRAKRGDRLVLPRLQDLDTTGDGVSRADRCLEVPVDVQEHGAGAGQLLGHDGVEDGAGDASLDDDLAEPGRARGLLVVVQRVVVAADLGEQLDVARCDRAGELGVVAWGGGSASGHLSSPFVG